MTIRLTFEVNTPAEAVEILTRASSPAGPAIAIDTAPTAPVAVPPQAGTSGIAAPSTPVASAAVLKLLADNGLNGPEIAGTGKDGRLTKADVTAYLKANVAPPEIDPFALDSPPATAAPAATKEQVREALIAYQTAKRNALIASGSTEEEAKAGGMNEARTLLGKVGNGATTLGALQETEYGTVVLAATAAVNALV